MWTYNYSNELYHHGVRGMKWGVRRYQNPDGSLTPRGEKRLAKLQSKADKLTGANNKSSVGGAYKQKGSGKITKRGEDLSNEEIDAALARKRKVDEYNRVFAEPPKAKKNSWAKDAAKDAANALKGVAIEKGKQQLGKYLETKLSDMLGTKDVLAEMKKETERLTAEVNLQNAKNNLKNSKFNRDNADLANEANVAALKSKKAAGINNEYKQTKEYNEAVARDKAAAEANKAKTETESKKEREPSSNYDTFIRNNQSSTTNAKNNYGVSTYVRRDAEAQYSRIKERYGDVIIDLSDEDFKMKHSGIGDINMWTYNYSNELYHHGVRGQKWGVRRYQNADGTLTDKGKKRVQKLEKKINSLYDHANKWTGKHANAMKALNRTAKAKVLDYAISENEKARKAKLDAIHDKNFFDTYNRNRKSEYADGLLNREYITRNSKTMTTFTSRAHEYNIQRGMRWLTSTKTLESTLRRMDPKAGYEYINKKELRSRLWSVDGVDYNDPHPLRRFKENPYSN